MANCNIGLRRHADGSMEGTRIETFDLLRKVADGEIDYAILKSNEFFVHHGLFPHLDTFYFAPTVRIEETQFHFFRMC